MVTFCPWELAMPCGRAFPQISPLWMRFNRAEVVKGQWLDEGWAYRLEGVTYQLNSPLTSEPHLKLNHDHHCVTGVGYTHQLSGSIYVLKPLLIQLIISFNISCVLLGCVAVRSRAISHTATVTKPSSYDPVSLVCFSKVLELIA